MNHIDRMRRELAPRQALFVAGMEQHGNPTRAVIQAGYATKTAAAQAKRMLRNEKIAAILQQSGEGGGMAEVTTAQVQARLLEVYDRCIEKQPVIKWNTDTKEWGPTGETSFDPKHALRAVELLGESIGMFEKNAGQVGREESIEEYLKRLGEEAAV